VDVRADRLVSILLMLQRQRHITAAQVAVELEISERTARRDLDALGAAGLPIYSVQGRNGGWRLAGDGRTDLSGLTAGEAKALFLVAGTSQTATPAVRAALRKLLRALPEPMRDHAEAAGRSLVIDPEHWGQPGMRPRAATPPPLLDELQTAVIEGRQQSMSYVDRSGASSERVIDPLGLASKGMQWYLVANTAAGLRTFRADRVGSLTATGEGVVRPEGFDLASAWKLITGEVDRLRTPVVAGLLIERDMVWRLRYQFGERLQIGPPTDEGRIAAEVRSASVWALTGDLAGFGRSVEVTGPDEVREALARIGDELVAQYRSGR
jgi:predicted DNA-binding transcriptional regulator YafY